MQPVFASQISKKTIKQIKHSYNNSGFQIKLYKKKLHTGKQRRTQTRAEHVINLNRQCTATIGNKNSQKVLPVLSERIGH